MVVFLSGFKFRAGIGAKGFPPHGRKQKAASAWRQNRLWAASPALQPGGSGLVLGISGGWERLDARPLV
jgi:hypothetical protein